jgi:hypothetical protein
MTLPKVSKNILGHDIGREDTCEKKHSLDSLGNEVNRRMGILDMLREVV